MPIPSGSDLVYPRPSGWASYPVYNVPVVAAVTVIDGNGGNLRVQLPENAIAGPITVQNCKNVVIIGGQINALPAVQINSTDQRMIYFNNISGILHIEGVYLNGAINGAESDGVTGNGSTTSVRIQKTRIAGLRGGQSTNHADCFQTWLGVKEMLFDRVTGDSNYQGIKFELTNSFVITRGIFSKVNLRGNSYTPTDGGGYYFWLDPAGLFPITITNFWVNPRGTRPLGQSVWPGETNSTNPINITGNTGTWPAGAKVSGTVNGGDPPGGDWAPASQVGLNYFTTTTSSGPITLKGTPSYAETSGVSVTVPAPSGVTLGEVLIAELSAQLSTVGPEVSGWQLIAGSALGSISANLYIRIVTAAEPSSYTFAGLPSGGHSVQIVRFSGVDPIVPLDGNGVGFNSGSSSTTITAPSITTTTDDTLVIYGLGLQSTASTSDFTPPNGVTMLAQDDPASIIGRRGFIFSEPRPTAGSTGSRVFTASASLPLAGAMVALRPATPGATFRVVDKWDGTKLIRQRTDQWDGSTLVQQIFDN